MRFIFLEKGYIISVQLQLVSLYLYLVQQFYVSLYFVLFGYLVDPSIIFGCSLISQKTLASSHHFGLFTKFVGYHFQWYFSINVPLSIYYLFQHEYNDGSNTKDKKKKRKKEKDSDNEDDANVTLLEPEKIENIKENETGTINDSSSSTLTKRKIVAAEDKSNNVEDDKEQLLQNSDNLTSKL